MTLFKDALEGQGDGDKHREEEDEDEEEGGFASAGGDGAGDPAPGPAEDDHQPTGPGDASDPDRSFGADDSFADPALDLDDDDGVGEGDASTPSKSVSSKSVSLLRSRPAPLSPPSPLIAPSDRASFRLVRQSSAGVSSGVSSVAAPQPSSGRDKVGGWGEGVTGDVQTRRMSKAEEVLKAATRHSSDDDDVDELASSSDGEGAGPGRGGGPSTPISSSPRRGSPGVYPPDRAAGPDPVRSARTLDRTGTFPRTAAHTAGQTPRRVARSAGGFRRSGTWRSCTTASTAAARLERTPSR